MGEVEVKAGAELEADAAEQLQNMADRDNVACAIGERKVAFVLDESVYKRDAVYGTAYLFIDRCFVFLTRPEESKIGVELVAREETPRPIWKRWRRVRERTAKPNGSCSGG